MIACDKETISYGVAPIPKEFCLPFSIHVIFPLFAGAQSRRAAFCARQEEKPYCWSSAEKIWIAAQVAEGKLKGIFRLKSELTRQVCIKLLRAFMQIA